MENSSIEALFILLAAVLPCSISGYLIAFKGYRTLISAYRESNFEQPQAFGKSVGISLIVFSLVLTAVAFVWHLKLLTENQLSNTVLLLLLLVLINYYRSLVTYRKKPKA